MKIAVVSDTHISNGPVPDYIISALGQVDLILHAGDILEMAVIERLSRIAETVAVVGNMDREEVARRLPKKTVVEAGGFKIGLTHGYGPPVGMIRKVRAEFDEVEVDCIVFGHTHNPMLKEKSGILFVNPGTPTDQRFASVNTLGFLELSDRITPRVMQVGPDRKPLECTAQTWK